MAPLPLGRIIAQVIVPLIATLARALPAAYNQALQNARKNGASAATSSSAQSIMSRKVMPKDQALLVLNLTEKEITAEAIQKQYEKYFEANSVERGGSFYLQSKIYRAKEMLDDYIKETKQQEQQDDDDSKK